MNAPIDDDNMGQAFWEDYRNRVHEKELRYPVQAGTATRCEDGLAIGGRVGRESVFRMAGLGSGAAGVSSIAIGALWLLSMFDFSAPWYSIFPIAALVAGGAFIVAAITYEARSEKQEVCSDRCDH